MAYLLLPSDVGPLSLLRLNSLLLGFLLVLIQLLLLARSRFLDTYIGLDRHFCWNNFGGTAHSGRLGRPGFLLAVVNLVVPLEVVALDKALPALLALVRALSSVREHVGPEDTVLLERLVALCARQLPILRVRPLVLPQIAGSSRLEIATRLCADVRLQVRVNQLVVLELALRYGGREG